MEVLLMADAFALTKPLAELRAQLLWIECGDPNKISRKYKRQMARAEIVDKKLKKLLNTLEQILLDTDLQAFTIDLQAELFHEQDLFEQRIEEQYRPLQLNYNSKALINKTQHKIPFDIELALSFGWKFLFPFTTTDENIHEVAAQLDHCITGSVSELQQHEAFFETAKILKERNNFEYDLNKCWLKFISRRTGAFFKMHDDCFPCRSDKGAHTVVIYTQDYDKAIAEMMNEAETYLKVGEHDNPLNELIKTEINLFKVLKSNDRTKDLLPDNFEPKTAQLAKFYGLPKVHKDGFKLRPIVSLIKAPGHALGKAFNQMLKIIFPINDDHIKDSYEMKRFIDQVDLDDNDIIASYDAVAMYTNIPRVLSMDLVLRQSDKFCTILHLNRELLTAILKFLLVDSTVFTTNTGIHRQIRGLAMGGSISTALARLVMDEVVLHAYSITPEITFIKIFVDDTLVAIPRGNQQIFLTALNSFHPQMKFTFEEEDENQSINFLNLTIIRICNRLFTRWYRKDFASGRLVNFFSSHKRTTVLGTAEAFIKTVISLSDPFFFKANKEIVADTLRDNSFPESVIQVLLNDCYTLMKPTNSKNTNLAPFDFYNSGTPPTKPSTGTVKKDEINYKIFPHAICKAREIKSVLHRLKKDKIVFAESTRNTKINHVRTRKSLTPLEDRSNLILITKCQCKTKFKIKCTKFNQTGKMLWNKIKTTYKLCDDKKHAFVEAKYRKGFFYQSQTEFLYKYLKYLYRGKVLDEIGHLPNYHFMKLPKKRIT